MQSLTLAVLPFMFLLPSLLFHLCFLVPPRNTIKVIDNPGLWFIMSGLALDFGAALTRFSKLQTTKPLSAQPCN
ncbi:hypothetical protein I314_02960 [Cryptococcus bacillisporus CA1873]|uniref:Uncharacterized protein n=1 Tax=Cryptococcus bacillisporus CA1873 TaxID=1296111 RepID=A0ABR5BC67_CRYGA|nr:hypothetical protein I314_02960 [Cryptococcus bacillisporus CA1873]|eukprot:KIR63558.1 hypothetical protein I314_02960 [Cryptococcus gattii CA1873]